VYPHVCEFILRHPHGAMAAPSGAKRRGTAARKTSAATKPRTTRRT